MKNLTYKGGARKGFVNVTWPFAKLKISKTHFELKAFMIGDFFVSGKDVFSITSYSGLFSKGLHISYQQNGEKENIFFWTWQNPLTVIKEIQNFWNER